MCSLSDPLNGYITYSVGPDVDGNFTFGTTAAYACDTGYSLVPLATVRTCDGDGSTVIGSFDGSEPTCEGQLFVQRLSSTLGSNYISKDNKWCWQECRLRKVVLLYRS